MILLQTGQLILSLAPQQEQFEGLDSEHEAELSLAPLSAGNVGLLHDIDDHGVCYRVPPSIELGSWKTGRFHDFPASSLRNSWAAGWICKAMAIELPESGDAVGPSSLCQGNSVTVYSTDAYEMRLVAGVFGPQGSRYFQMDSLSQKGCCFKKMLV